jgi:inner membrane protein
MASAFSHAVIAIALGKIYSIKKLPKRFWVLGMICAIFPDIDVLAFKFGIPYESFWGHRGFTHSFVFAFLFSLAITLLFFSKTKKFSLSWFGLVFYFFLSTAFHPIVDAMTTGGLGVAFFAPFDNHRYFFPWRPIAVSPIGVGRFFSEWGWRVIKSEFLWIWLPCLALIFTSYFFREIIFKEKNDTSSGNKIY